MLRAALSRIRATFRRGRLDQEFEREIRLHLEMLAERFIRLGMDPVEASYAARRQFGGLAQVTQDLRERRALPQFGVLLRDIRHAFRQLRNARRFTAAAALTLALGIGASTAVFAVLDAVVLRPLPYPDPERLMAFRSLDRRGAPRPTSLSYPNFFDFRKGNRVFEHLVCYRDARFALTDSLPPIQVAGQIVSWDLFPMLRIQPQLGRGFLPDEERPGVQVTVLSHSLWKSRFGGDPAILGRRIRLNGKPFTVVGVAPAGFRFPAEDAGTQLWTTLSQDAAGSEQRGSRVLDVIGRLKPGVSAEQARAQMDLVAGALARQYPDDNKNIRTTSVRPELERLAGSSREPLWILLGAVTLVLLIACANVANLLLARSTERAREFALRTALGASRASIIRQVLIESLVLGLLGTAGGVLLAWGALDTVLPLAGDHIPRLSQAGVDGRVLGFGVLAAVLTSVLFSLAPALQAAGADPVGGLKEGARSIARGRDRLPSALVIAQITLGLVLLVAAGLLMAGFLHLTRRDPGFRTDHLLTFEIGLPETRYDASGQIAFSDRLLERLRAIPGVQAAAIGRPLPLEGRRMSVAFDIEERPAAVPDRPISNMAIVTPGYFGAIGIPVLKGREFTDRDDATAPPVLVVNEAFARRHFPGQEVIGKRIQPGAHNGEGPRMREIVGVVRNAKQVPLNPEPDPIYYFPYKQLSWGIGAIVLRTAVPPLELESAARAALASLDRQAPMYQVRTGEGLAAGAIAAPRFLTVLMGSFAGISLVLTIVGLYGVLAYAVARRRREIGLRIALGATRGEVLGLVFRQAVRLVAAGLLLGLAGAAAGARLLRMMLYGADPVDAVIMAIASCCAIVITAAAAAYIPAARAACVDPTEALRSE
jgi:putative ABC transport system permease protein